MNKYLGIAIGFIIANYLWAYFISKDYETAFERSWFQMGPIFVLWLHYYLDI